MLKYIQWRLNMKQTKKKRRPQFNAVFDATLKKQIKKHFKHAGTANFRGSGEEKKQK